MSEDLKKKRVTVSLRPAGDEAWSKRAQTARVSKGHLAAWLARSPEAGPARKAAIKAARFFVPPD
jgi:hypothetical protein